MRGGLGVWILAWGLVGCKGAVVEPAPKPAQDKRRHNFGSLFGHDGLVLQGKRERASSTEPTVQANKFLWQSVLETFAFMPIYSASPQTGRLITDWYSDPHDPNIRLRVAARVQGEAFRVDAVQVVVDRQKRENDKAAWRAFPYPDKSRAELEVLIVERACQIRKKFLAEKR